MCMRVSVCVCVCVNESIICKYSKIQAVKYEKIKFKHLKTQAVRSDNIKSEITVIQITSDYSSPLSIMRI